MGCMMTNGMIMDYCAEEMITVFIVVCVLLRGTEIATCLPFGTGLSCLTHCKKSQPATNSLSPYDIP